MKPPKIRSHTTPSGDIYDIQLVHPEVYRISRCAAQDHFADFHTLRECYAWADLQDSFHDQPEALNTAQKKDAIHARGYRWYYRDYHWQAMTPYGDWLRDRHDTERECVDATYSRMRNIK